MSYRFFYPLPPVEGSVTLAGDQAHHAVNVMRYRQGDRIVIFDGQGNEHDAEIESLSKKQLVARVLESRQFDRALSRPVKIVVALPKGDRQKFLVEKLVELGVTTLIPLATSRSVAEVTPKVIERIEKQIVEASKQCGRNFLMQIEQPVSVSNLSDLETKYVKSEPILKLLAHPYRSQELSDVACDSATQPVAIVIGPEGGFSDEEVEQLTSGGWHPISLGPTILRIETAAIAAAAIFGIGKRGR